MSTTKLALAFTALMMVVFVYGSMSLRHAFVEKHTQTVTTNSIIDEASR